MKTRQDLSREFFPLALVSLSTLCILFAASTIFGGPNIEMELEHVQAMEESGQIGSWTALRSGRDKRVNGEGKRGKEGYTVERITHRYVCGC